MGSEFGTLLRQLRRRAGITQEQLAMRSGVGVRTIRRLETSQQTDPRQGTVQALADALDLLPAERAALLGAANPVPAESLQETAATVLAVAVERWLRREEEQLLIADREQLPVRWRTSADAAGQVDLAGRLDEIGVVYDRVSSGRLVLLGRPGSGKTVLAKRFILDSLKVRGGSDPVPVIFQLATWNPRLHTLRDWLADQLAHDFPQLARSDSGALVRTGHVLPVLDGFDEMPPDLRRDAIAGLNSTVMPMLLVSRIEEYRDAGAGLVEAGSIELIDLAPEDVATYLTRSSHHDWSMVRTSPKLSKALATPLMVSIARWVAPAELAELPGSEAIEDRLAGIVITKAYPDRPPRRWLGYLASRLHQAGITTFTWRELPQLVPRQLRALLIGVLSGLLIGVTSGLVNGVRFGLGIGLFAMVVLGLIQEALSARVPAGTLKTSRTTAILQTAIVGGALAVIQGVLSGFKPELFTWLAVAVAGGLGLTTWGRWLLFVRCWLPLTGRLPWKVLPFLDDARDRGLLRRVGEAYQFRYRQFQDHLAGVAFVPVTIYLSEEGAHEEIEAAVEEVLRLAGAEIDERDEPVLGSWFRRMRARFSSPATREAMKTAIRAGDARLQAQDALSTEALMRNLGQVITALGSTKDAVVRVGALLIVKANEKLVVHQLTPAQLLQLDHNPSLALSPGDILNALQIETTEHPVLSPPTQDR